MLFKVAAVKSGVYQKLAPRPSPTPTGPPSNEPPHEASPVKKSAHEASYSAMLGDLPGTDVGEAALKWDVYPQSKTPRASLLSAPTKNVPPGLPPTSTETSIETLLRHESVLERLGGEQGGLVMSNGTWKPPVDRDGDAVVLRTGGGGADCLHRVTSPKPPSTSPGLPAGSGYHPVSRDGIPGTVWCVALFVLPYFNQHKGDVLSQFRTVNQSIDGRTKQSNDRTHQSINQSINQSISRINDHSFNPSINQSINHSIKQSFNQSINQSINPWINQSWQKTVKLKILNCFH